jgi:hypothetical protein
MNPNDCDLEEKAANEFDKERFEAIVENLKTDINNFLWDRLPNNITLEKEKIIATRTFDMIFNSWNKL